MLPTGLDRGPPQRATQVLTLRLLALGVVAGSTAFLPSIQVSPASAALAIVAGSALGGLQYAGALRDRRHLLAAVVPGHAVVWTYLLFLAREPRSPLFVGYMLEQVLSAMLLSRAGVLLATGSGIVGYAVYAFWGHVAMEPAGHLAILGALAVSGLLTDFLVTGLERQALLLGDLQEALQVRASNLTEELRLLGDYLAGALLTLDELGRIVGVNRAGSALLESNPEDILGHPWQEVLHPDPTSAKLIAATLCEGSPQRSLPMLLDRGSDGILCATAQAWTSPSGDGPRTYIYIIPNLPPAQAGDPLQKLGLAAACVAHQIKNSLGALQGYLGRVRAAPGAAASWDLESFGAALHSLGALAEDVLVLSGRPGSARAVRDWLSARELIEGAVALARPTKAGVEVHVPDEPLLVYGARAQLSHALFNLLDNALRASNGSGAVRIVAQRDGDAISISVLDHGSGMPAGVDGTAPGASTNGWGIGLLAARRYVEANGGQLHIAARAMGGTACTIRLASQPPGAPAPPTGCAEAD